ncbi:MAG: flagellar hook-associated protein FlgL [Candidatus Lernaella stagnicola]|nr:flagellar hook-associated protein FlgL [Candidatus Lernaella stagnicola]
MRITTSMMFQNVSRNIGVNLDKYYRLQEQLYTQRRINRPSDDPVGTTKVLELRELISRFDQFERNISTAETYSSQTDVAMNNIVERLQRNIELAVSVNNPLTGPDEFLQAAAEMDNIYQEVLRNANTKFGDRFIFSGYETTTAPFDDAGNYLGGAPGQDIEVEVAQGEFMAINLNGEEVFKGPLDIMQLLQDTAIDVASGDRAAISGRIADLGDALDQTLMWTTINGARANRIEIAKEDNYELRDSFIAIMSDVEDINITEVTTEFAQQEQILEANRLISARLLNQNFLDFFA